jgi:hypothetical protein
VPDINGNYLGDRSGVLPTNNAALIHFSDQFAQMAERRRQEKAMQQREDQQMRNRVNSAISSHIFNPNFLKTDGSNPQMQGLMSQYANEALNKLKTEGEQSAYQYIYDKTGELNGYNQALKQAHENVVNAATNYAKDNPGVQKEALANLLSSKMFSKTDANGNIVPKDLSEIDPTQNYLQDVLKEHGQDLYSEGTSVAALNKDIQGLATDNPKVPSNIDNKGNIISRGYSATKFPSKALDVVPDGRGGFTTQLKSQDYSLDGKTPYVDQNGQTVKVLPPELQSYFGNNNAIAAKVERMTRQQLSDVNATGQQIDRDSPYGEMLYQKNLYDFVNGGLKDRYSVNADDAEKQARAIRDKNFSQDMQRQNLGISKQRLSISQQAMQMRKDRIAKGLDPDGGLPDFLSSMADQYGEDVEVVDNPGKPAVTHWFKPNEPAIPATTATKKIIPATADARDLDIIAGKPNSLGERPIPPRTFTKPDGTTFEGWEYNPQTGNAIGQDGKEINGNAVQRNVYQTLKKGTINELRNGNKANTPKAKTNSFGLPIIK